MKWAEHRPHKGDAIYDLHGKHIGTVSLVDNSICWLEGGNCFIWCFMDTLNNQHNWKRKARQVEAHDLELYAINTGEFYQLHKKLAPENAWAWIKHVRDNVMPRYCKEIEPIWATSKVVEAVAVALKEYYQRHVEESR
jgi:hypothetical protein